MTAEPDDWRRMDQELDLPPGTTLAFIGYRARGKISEDWLASRAPRRQAEQWRWCRLGESDRWTLRRLVEWSVVPLGCFIVACIGAAVGISALDSHALGLVFAVAGSLAVFVGGHRWLDRPGGAGEGPELGLLAGLALVFVVVVAAFLIGSSPLLELRDDDLVAFVVCVAAGCCSGAVPAYWT